MSNGNKAGEERFGFGFSHRGGRVREGVGNAVNVIDTAAWIRLNFAVIICFPRGAC